MKPNSSSEKRPLLVHPVPPRDRKVRILATLGPASSGVEMIRKLYLAGADAFRINMSHGDHAMHAQNIAAIRALEKEMGRPTTILADLQGPKLRVGTFAAPPAVLTAGQPFRLDSDPTPGDAARVCLPHPEILGALVPGARLLLDDGKLVLRVVGANGDHVDTVVEVGGPLSDRKGVNLPDVVVPLAALTDKDRRDLTFALDHHVDWIALSFVQRPEDVAEARTLIRGRAGVLVKFEKPQGLARLDEILELADACMVARGDLGVELPPERVPPAQKRIVATARAMGKPVVVATQMLESMIVAPTPTRAEVSDVATAVYDGADAVMLSAETAAGAWPVEAVTMMDRIARSVEADPGYRARIEFTETVAQQTTADALSEAAGSVTGIVGASAIVCFTGTGSTARRVSRERPQVPLLVLTPKLEAARRMALRHGFGVAGSKLVMLAGVPFGTPGSTNVLHVATLTGDELKSYRSRAE
jgi:pyruvate kinase